MPHDGLQLRLAGLEIVERNNADFVAEMRTEATRIMKKCGTVTVDDLRKIAAERGITPKSPNAWGPIFHLRSVFRPVGYTQSTIPSNHARVIRVWGAA